MSDFESTYELSNDNIETDTVTKVLAEAMSNKFINNLSEQITSASNNISRQEIVYKFLKESLNMFDNYKNNLRKFSPIIVEKQKRINDILKLPMVKDFDILNVENGRTSLVVFLNATIYGRDQISNFVYRYLQGERVSEEESAALRNIDNIDRIEFTIPVSFDLISSLFSDTKMRNLIESIQNIAQRITDDSYDDYINHISDQLFYNAIIPYTGFDNFKLFFTTKNNIHNGYGREINFEPLFANSGYNDAKDGKDIDIEKLLKDASIETIFDYISNVLFTKDNRLINIDTSSRFRNYMEYCNATPDNVKFIFKEIKEEKNNE